MVLFVYARLEVMAFAGVLWCPWCDLKVAGLRLLWFSNAHDLQHIKGHPASFTPPCKVSHQAMFFFSCAGSAVTALYTSHRKVLVFQFRDFYAIVEIQGMGFNTELNKSTGRVLSIVLSGHIRKPALSGLVTSRLRLTSQRGFPGRGVWSEQNWQWVGNSVKYFIDTLKETPITA